MSLLTDDLESDLGQGGLADTVVGKALVVPGIVPLHRLEGEHGRLVRLLTGGQPSILHHKMNLIISNSSLVN